MGPEYVKVLKLIGVSLVLSIYFSIYVVLTVPVEWDVDVITRVVLHCRRMGEQFTFRGRAQ